MRLRKHPAASHSERHSFSVLMTHHFGAKLDQLSRHIHLLNELGCDVHTFYLAGHGDAWMQWRPNMRSFWARQMCEAAEAIPGPLLIFSLSGPAASAIDFLAEAHNSGAALAVKKYVGLICDSGPFFDAWLCTDHLLEQHYKIKNAKLRRTLLWLLMALWGPNHGELIHQNLKALQATRPQFPILSLRAKNDELVPVEQIAQAFTVGPPVQALLFENAGHLTALKLQPDRYREAVKGFLESLEGASSGF